MDAEIVRAVDVALSQEPPSICLNDPVLQHFFSENADLKSCLYHEAKSRTGSRNATALYRKSLRCYFAELPSGTRAAWHGLAASGTGLHGKLQPAQRHTQDQVELQLQTQPQPQPKQQGQQQRQQQAPLQGQRTLVQFFGKGPVVATHTPTKRAESAQKTSWSPLTASTSEGSPTPLTQTPSSTGSNEGSVSGCEKVLLQQERPGEIARPKEQNKTWQKKGRKTLMTGQEEPDCRTASEEVEWSPVAGDNQAFEEDKMESPQPVKRYKTDVASVRAPSCKHAEIRQFLRQSPPETLGFLTWNISGLDESRGAEGLVLRTLEVAREIAKEQPLAVLLQEVVNPALDLLRDPSVLGSRYEAVVPQDPMLPYYVAMLLDKERLRRIGDTVSIDYAGSQMGRQLLAVPVELLNGHGPPLLLTTAHFESDVHVIDAETAAERKRQLMRSVKYLKRSLGKVPPGAPGGAREIGAALLGGDLSLREADVRSLWRARQDELSGIADAFEYCGSPEHSRWTCVPAQGEACRHDRVYFLSPGFSDKATAVSSGEPCAGWRPTRVSVVGQRRVPELGRCASSHWGLLTQWKLGSFEPGESEQQCSLNAAASKLGPEPSLWLHEAGTRVKAEAGANAAVIEVQVKAELHDAAAAGAFPCRFCDFVATSRADAMKHLLVKHKDLPWRPLNTNLQHLCPDYRRRAHLGEAAVLEEPGGFWKCSVCSYLQNTKCAINIHITKSHFKVGLPGVKKSTLGLPELPKKVALASVRIGKFAKALSASPRKKAPTHV